MSTIKKHSYTANYVHRKAHTIAHLHFQEVIVWQWVTKRLLFFLSCLKLVVGHYYYLNLNMYAPYTTLPLCNPCVQLLCAKAVLVVSAHHLFFSLCKQKLSLSLLYNHMNNMITPSWHVTPGSTTASPVCICAPLCLYIVWGLNRGLCGSPSLSVNTAEQLDEVNSAWYTQIEFLKSWMCVFLATAERPVGMLFYSTPHCVL